MRTNQSGFTLIELLVVIAIIGIIAAMGVMNFRVIQAHSYNAHVDKEMHDLQTALMAGRLELSTRGGMYGGWSMSAGPVMDWSGVDFLPGFRNHEGVQVFAWYDADCENGGRGPMCLVGGGTVSWCKSGKTKSTWSWADGVSADWEWTGAPWC